MAVVDKYANASVEAGTRVLNLFGRGEKTTVSRQIVAVAAADDDGSVYRVLKGIPTKSRIQKIEILNSAITAGTDYDLGFYKTDKGAVIDKDVLMDGQSFATAHAVGEEVQGNSNVALTDMTKTIGELLGLDFNDSPSSVDLCLTANTVGTAAGTIVMTVTLIPEVV